MELRAITSLEVKLMEAETAMVTKKIVSAQRAAARC